MVEQTIRQGDLALLDDIVARELLRSTIPARFAYLWKDGTPRVVPIWFHWDGEEFVLGSPPGAPKLKALPQNGKAALTIDTETPPYHVLMVRGSVSVRMVEGVTAEYAASARRYMGEEQGQAWAEMVASRFPRMARIAIRPDWVGILDFETRFPSALA
jgi:nitroimidazol reductase NimA-like FMN-containing flavoprotein (pyridoxamine 5'-phosphate oxidase superfamily)